MTAPSDTTPPKANFSNIARHLTEAITSGHFAIGALLPTELELCKHYGTSRHTVRVALAELQQLGLVSRTKSVGTRVISARPRASFRPSLASVDDLVQFGAEHLRVVQGIEEVTLPASLAQELGSSAGRRWLRISSLRMEAEAQAAPVGWTDVYIDPSYAVIGELVKASPDTLVSALLEEHFGRQIEQIQQDVRAFTLTDAKMADRLQVPAGSAALRIVRRYFDAEGEMFEGSVSVHPADRFLVSMRLRR